MSGESPPRATKYPSLTAARAAATISGSLAVAGDRQPGHGDAAPDGRRRTQYRPDRLRQAMERADSRSAMLSVTAMFSTAATSQVQRAASLSYRSRPVFCSRRRNRSRNRGFPAVLRTITSASDLASLLGSTCRASAHSSVARSKIPAVRSRLGRAGRQLRARSHRPRQRMLRSNRFGAKGPEKEQALQSAPWPGAGSGAARRRRPTAGRPEQHQGLCAAYDRMKARNTCSNRFRVDAVSSALTGGGAPSRRDRSGMSAAITLGVAPQRLANVAGDVGALHLRRL